MTKIATCTVWMLVGSAVLASSAGCSNDPTRGYTLNSQYIGGIKTVAVPIFTRGKDVYRRELEMRLTEAVIKRIELDTPYKVTDKSRADTELRGSLDVVSQRVLSFNPDSGLPREKEITLVVSFTWTDLRTGKVIVRRSNFRQASPYIPAQPLVDHGKPGQAFTEDFFLGSEDVINKLAERIVQQMEADWDLPSTAAAGGSAPGRP